MSRTGPSLHAVGRLPDGWLRRPHGLAVVEGYRPLHRLAGPGGVAGVVVGDGETEPAAPVVRGVLGLGLAPGEDLVGRVAVDAAAGGAPQLVDGQAALGVEFGGEGVGPADELGVLPQEPDADDRQDQHRHAEGDGQERAGLDQHDAAAADQDEVEDQDGGRDGVGDLRAHDVRASVQVEEVFQAEGEARASTPPGGRRAGCPA